MNLTCNGSRQLLETASQLRTASDQETILFVSKRSAISEELLHQQIKETLTEELVLHSGLVNCKEVRHTPSHTSTAHGHCVQEETVVRCPTR